MECDLVKVILYLDKKDIMKENKKIPLQCRLPLKTNNTTGLKNYLSAKLTRTKIKRKTPFSKDYVTKQ
jgi:hypothetical protein